MDTLKKLTFASIIPKEMFWAYEAVRRSGYWNMLCVDLTFGRYHNSDSDEMIDTMTKAYYKFIEYTGVDVEEEGYSKLTRDHIKLIQYCYSTLSDSYMKSYPEGVVNIKVNKTVKVNISI